MKHLRLLFLIFIVLLTININAQEEETEQIKVDPSCLKENKHDDFTGKHIRVTKYVRIMNDKKHHVFYRLKRVISDKDTTHQFIFNFYIKSLLNKDIYFDSYIDSSCNIYFKLKNDDVVKVAVINKITPEKTSLGIKLYTYHHILMDIDRQSINKLKNNPLDAVRVEVFLEDKIINFDILVDEENANNFNKAYRCVNQ